VQRTLGGERIDGSQADLGAECHPDGDGPVELDNRRAGHARERLIQRGDSYPIEVLVVSRPTAGTAGASFVGRAPRGPRSS